MDEIVPGLWVGDLACALSTEYLSLANITHIVTALKQRLPPPPRLPDGRTIPPSNLLHIPIDDEEGEPILVHFPFVNDFLESVLHESWIQGKTGNEALDEQRASDGSWGHWETTGSGNVLVHCQAGCSRSVALVVAYIMSKRGLSRDDALEMIQARRSMADPNEGFMSQLELYENADCQIDLRHAPIRRFLMGKVDILNGGSVEDVLMSYFPEPTSPAAGPSSAVGSQAAKSYPFAGLSERSASTSNEDEIEEEERPSSRTSVGPRSRRNSITSQDVDLSMSPAMPRNTDDLFTESNRQDPSESSASSSNSKKDRAAFSTWATSITSPHEVVVARSGGSKLPGGAPSIRGLEARPSTNGATQESNSAASTSSSAHRALASPDASQSARVRNGTLPVPKYSAGTPRLRCKLCRREIAVRDHVVEHEPGKGIMAFDVKKRHKELRNSDNRNIDAVDRGSAAPKLNGQSENVDGDDDDEIAKRLASQSLEDAAVRPDATQNIDSTRQGEQQSPNIHSPTAAAADSTSPSTTSSAPPASASTPIPQPSVSSREQDRLAAMARLRRQMGVGSNTASASTMYNGSAPTASSTVSTVSAGASSSTSKATAREPILHSNQCSSYFLEPLDWMYTLSASPTTSTSDPSDSTTTTTTAATPTSTSTSAAASLSSGHLAGKLLCPNHPRCKSKLGNWDWAGMQCGCGAWITPAFAVSRARVDEVWE